MGAQGDLLWSFAQVEADTCIVLSRPQESQPLENMARSCVSRTSHITHIMLSAAVVSALPRVRPAFSFLQCSPTPFASKREVAKRDHGSLMIDCFGTRKLERQRRHIHVSMALHQNKVAEIEAQLKADDPEIKTNDAAEKINLYSLNPQDLEALMEKWSVPKFRAKQVHQWLYEKGVTDFDQCSNLSKDLREKLKGETTLGTLELANEQVSKDGTIKRAYALPDGQLIESVLMPYEDGRNTACISSQVISSHFVLVKEFPSPNQDRAQYKSGVEKDRWPGFHKSRCIPTRGTDNAVGLHDNHSSISIILHQNHLSSNY